MSIPHSPENGKGSLRFVCGTPDMLSASSSIPAARGARNRPSCPPQPPASSVLSLGAAARPALPPTGLSRRKSLKAEAFLFGDPVPRDAVRSLPAGRRNVVHSHSFRRKAGPCFDGENKDVLEHTPPLLPEDPAGKALAPAKPQDTLGDPPQAQRGDTADETTPGTSRSLRFTLGFFCIA